MSLASDQNVLLPLPKQKRIRKAEKKAAVAGHEEGEDGREERNNTRS